MRSTRSGYVEYRFADGSLVHIRPDSEVVRTPAPRYNAEGRRINRGLRLDKDGGLLQTRDAEGNLIPGTHQTGERLSD